MTKQFNIEDQIDHSLMPRFILVVKDRYAGTYSHHQFIAWNYGIPIKGSEDPCLSWCYGEPCDSSDSESIAEDFWNDVRANPEKHPFHHGGRNLKEAVLNFLNKDTERVWKELFEGVIFKDDKGSCKLHTFKELGI
jgi:hypothetical protein